MGVVGAHRRQGVVGPGLPAASLQLDGLSQSAVGLEPALPLQVHRRQIVPGIPVLWFQLGTPCVGLHRIAGRPSHHLQGNDSAGALDRSVCGCNHQGALLRCV